MAEQKLLFCFVCMKFTNHKIYGNQAVCLDCGKNGDLTKPHVEAETQNRGDRERRV